MDYLKLIQILTKHPLRVFKSLNKENIAKYKHAIRTEHPGQILRNIERYLTNKHTVFNASQEVDAMDRIDQFISNIKEHNQQDPKPIILFVSHEATLTGAPLIIQKVAGHFRDYHEVCPVFILLKGGKIQDLFVEEFPTYQFHDKHSEYEKIGELRKLLPILTGNFSIEYSFVNSAESRYILPLLKKAKIPKVISLVHEMGNLYPKKSWRIINRYSDHIIFPCEFVRQKANENTTFHPSLTSVRGQGLLKPGIFEANYSASRTFVRRELGIPEDAVIVLSCGTPIARKGIDLFVFTAISTLSKWKGTSPLYFLWVGDAPDNHYQQWARRDIDNSGFADHILWVDSQEDIIPWFVGSDMFFLTSRGDPFPCVVHEALAAGLPVIGFENTGGLQEMVPPQASIIQPYGDLAATSTAIISRLKNPDPNTRTSIINYAKQNLDNRKYSEYLYSIATKEIDHRVVRADQHLGNNPLAEELPVPPPSLMHYNESQDVHLKMGQVEVENIRKCLQDSGYDVAGIHKILEFGCNNCRLLRWFYDEDVSKELWGCDVDKPSIQWGKENLGQIINLLHNDHYPKLDFKENYFELVFAGSIFTHIKKNDKEWLNELTRITKPGGLLYLTFLDEHSMRTLANERERPVYKRVAAHPDAPEIWEGAFERICFPAPNSPDGKGSELVLCHSDYIQRMNQQELELIHIMKKAYAGFQTAYLFRKK